MTVYTYGLTAVLISYLSPDIMQAIVHFFDVCIINMHPKDTLLKPQLKNFTCDLLCSSATLRYDPEVIFAEPVTDEIAPGYSALIKHPMDLSTMATKLSNHAYSSVDEFRSDFVLMCKNAMTYNAPETVYFSFAKSMMEDGIKIIERVSPFFYCPFPPQNLTGQPTITIALN